MQLRQAGLRARSTASGAVPCIPVGLHAGAIGMQSALAGGRAAGRGRVATRLPAPKRQSERVRVVAQSVSTLSTSQQLYSSVAVGELLGQGFRATRMETELRAPTPDARERDLLGAWRGVLCSYNMKGADAGPWRRPLPWE